ncbi:MAG TPA: polyphosphate kinase 1 [Gemmatimonadaceae bacterium]|nr:polyphosphate kinase 1 [Gemmatimonadaceae bacterium]
MTTRERRFDVVSAEQLERLASEPLPLGLKSTARRVLYRDLYVDTEDDQLQRRGLTCRLRVGSDDRRLLTVFVANTAGGAAANPSEPWRRFEALVDSADPRQALESGTEPARRLAAVVDFRMLLTKLELQVERVERVGDPDWLGRPRLHVYCDRIHVRSGTSSRAFHQLTVRCSRRRMDVFDRFCAALQDTVGLRPIVAGTRERAQLLLKWMEREERGRAKVSDAGVALVLTRGPNVALFKRGDVLFLPFEKGFGVGVARTLLDRCCRQPGTDTRLLGKLSSLGPMPTVEVWTAELPMSAEVTREHGDVMWLGPMEALDRAPELHPDTLAALSVAVRSGLLTEVKTPPAVGGGARSRIDPRRSVELTGWRRETMGVSSEGEAAVGDPRFLNSELSILEFTSRVLALAEDIRTPLAERLRFLAIVADNLDEFFMVRVAGLKRSALEQAEERTPDGLTPRQQLDLISLHVQSLVARQYRCYAACAEEASPHGARIVTWPELDVGRRDQLRAAMRDELLPALTPLAMTLSPGHPFPRLRHLSLSLAVVLLDQPGAAPHFAQVELPDDAPRFTPVPGMRGAVITMEELVRANLDLLYPSSVVEQAYAFRVTRGADLEIDEDRAPSLLHAVEEASRRRFEQPVVRVEVERAMPAVLRDVVLRELRREHGGAALDTDDLYEVDGPLDLGALSQLPLSGGAGLEYPAFRGGDPLPREHSIWSLVEARDRLFHHPFDDYETTVVRFFREAATDPLVTAIKLTVYRAGEQSPIVAALVDAASHGKDVVAFVELKARFDEERNIGWARRLEEAGGRVVHGLVGVKNHAKVALVVRRDGNRLRRFVHVGTGNYNVQTARRYTDLSLLSADEDLTADVQDLFNELTGSSRAPNQLTRGCLISPKQLLPEIVAKIEREAMHARAGRLAHIRMKLNGLSDPDVVSALFRASQDGVQIDLVVRGVCTLRPGMTSVSHNIRVVSVLGRFLEHARVFHFANAGAHEYYIGSADMRPRNLRRRVELLVPVRDATCRAQLDALLDAYINDPTAWELTSAGEYLRRHGTGASAQDQLVAEAVLAEAAE